MKDLSIVCILFGTFIIAPRIPIIIAPDAWRKFLLKSILPSNFILRIIGIFVVAFGVAMIIASAGYDQTGAILIKRFGWFLAIAPGSIFLIFTSVFKDIILNILENMDELTFRIFGIIGAGVGALFIYFGWVIN